MEILGEIIGTNYYLEFPELIGRLKLPNNKWSPEVVFIIDTGFTGDVLLAHNLFEIWSEKMLRMPSDAEVAENVTGEIITLQSVDSFLQLHQLHKFPVVISSQQQITTNLIGWNLLRRMTSVLQATQITLLESTN